MLELLPPELLSPWPNEARGGAAGGLLYRMLPHWIAAQSLWAPAGGQVQEVLLKPMGGQYHVAFESLPRLRGCSLEPVHACCDLQA